MEKVLRQVQRPYKDFILHLKLLTSSLSIEVTTDDKIYYTNICNDTLSENENLSDLFDHYEEIYQYLVQDNFEI